MAKVCQQLKQFINHHLFFNKADMQILYECMEFRKFCETDNISWNKIIQKNFRKSFVLNVLGIPKENRNLFYEYILEKALISWYPAVKTNFNIIQTNLNCFLMKEIKLFLLHKTGRCSKRNSKPPLTFLVIIYSHLCLEKLM